MAETSNPSLYAARDHYALSPHFERHMLALTGERLESKSSIAAELAHRDAEIERLRAALERITALEIPLGISKPMPATAFAEAKSIAHKALFGAPGSAVETSGWRPIETAPKDWRTLLLGYFNSHGKWRSLHGQWFEQCEMDEWTSDDEGNPAGWYEISVENDDPPNCWATEPTHWQPTPKPPEKAPERPLTLLDFGYAPGVYAFHCLDCDQEDIGDKRAIRCKTCAQKALSALKASPRREPEIMDIHSPVGSKLIFSFPRNGYPSDVAEAGRRLVEGQTYTLSRIEVHGSHTNVWLKELPDYGSFNSVQFSNAQNGEE